MRTSTLTVDPTVWACERPCSMVPRPAVAVEPGSPCYSGGDDDRELVLLDAYERAWTRDTGTPAPRRTLEEWRNDRNPWRATV